MKLLSSLLTICMFFWCSMVYGQSKVLVIGEQTQLQSEMIGKQLVEKSQVQSPSNGKKSKKLQLNAAIKEVYVNGANFKGKGFAEHPYLKAAMDKKLPIVIENAQRKDVEALTGFGVDANVMVIQAAEDVRGLHMVVVEESATTHHKSPNLSKKLVEKEGYEEASISVDTTKLSPKELQEMHKKAKEMANPALNKKLKELKGKTSKQQAPKRQVPTLKERSNKTKKAIEQIKNRQAVHFKQGALSEASNEYYVSTNPMFGMTRDLTGKENLSKSRQRSYAKEKSLITDLPNYAKYYIDFVALKGWHSQNARIDVSYDICLYATTQPAAKYLLIRSKGRVNPGKLAQNHERERGYFTERFIHNFGLFNNTDAGYLERSAPENANDKTEISVTTGFSIGVSVGIGLTGPTAGITAGYSESTTIKGSIDDFKVTNNSNNQLVKMDYQLSKQNGGVYSNWKSLMYQHPFQVGKIHGVPTWATSNMYPHAEGTWKFPANHNKSELLKLDRRHVLRRVQETKNWIWNAHYLSWHRVEHNVHNPSVDFSKVQVPHLGINASVSQSSTRSAGGHASRAIDGDVDGKFSNNSVTHTNQELTPWWEVDLGTQAANTVLKTIDVWNRTDCCTSRLKEYYLFVSDVPLTDKDLAATIAQAEDNTGNVSAYEVNNGDMKLRNLPINRTGRYIRIQLKKKGILSLAEVRIVPVGSH